MGANKGTVDEVKQEEEIRAQDSANSNSRYFSIKNSELSVLVSTLIERMRDYVEEIRTEFNRLQEKEELERRSPHSVGLDEIIEKYFTAKVALNVKLRKGYREKFMKDVIEVHAELLSRLPTEYQFDNTDIVKRTPKDVDSLEGIINYLDRLHREFNKRLQESE